MAELPTQKINNVATKSENRLGSGFKDMLNPSHSKPINIILTKTSKINSLVFQ